MYVCMYVQVILQNYNVCLLYDNNILLDPEIMRQHHPIHYRIAFRCISLPSLIGGEQEHLPSSG